MTTPRTPGHHSHPARPGHGPAHDHDSDLGELLDLDAAVGATVLAAALDAASTALGTVPDRAVDLGAGTGTGTLALAHRFPQTQVHSLDASPEMLGRLDEAVTAAGVAARVRAHLVDLDGDWPAALPGDVDLAWAALSLHHVSAPAAVLRQVFDALRPGGVLVVIEMLSAAEYDPADLGTGRSGLGARLTDALAAQGYPATGEWTAALVAAGFQPVERKEHSLSASSSTEEGSRYLELQLSRNRTRLADGLDPSDLSALDTVISALGTSAPTTRELRFTSGRAVWVAVRPIASGDGLATQFSGRVEAENCERILGERRHGL